MDAFLMEHVRNEALMGGTLVKCIRKKLKYTPNILLVRDRFDDYITQCDGVKMRM